MPRITLISWFSVIGVGGELFGTGLDRVYNLNIFIIVLKYCYELGNGWYILTSISHFGW